MKKISYVAIALLVSSYLQKQAGSAEPISTTEKVVTSTTTPVKNPLSKEQIDRMQSIQQSYFEQIVRKRADLEIAENNLRIGLNKPNPDKTSLLNQQSTINGFKADLANLHLSCELDKLTVLTVEQRANRPVGPMPPFPPFGPPPGGMHPIGFGMGMPGIPGMPPFDPPGLSPMVMPPAGLSPTGVVAPPIPIEFDTEISDT